MKRALLLALLAIAGLAVALPALAAEGALDFTIAVDPAAQLAAAPAPLPGEDGLVVYEAHHYRYADGLMRHRHQRLLRVTTEWALERLADPRLRFDSARQKITVHAARTYLPGGGAVDSPSNAFNTVTPGELALAPDFLDIQELVITHVGLEPGCALWLDTEIVDTAPAGLPEGALLFPQGEFPVLAMDVTAEGIDATISKPEGGLFALLDVESECCPPRWRFKNLPAAPGQAAYRLGDQLTHLNFSPVQGWRAVVEAIEASREAAVTDTAGLGNWLASVERDLDRPFLNDRDAIAACLAALGERTALLDGSDWAWRAPRSVARVLETSVATPLERTALMIAICRVRRLQTSLELPTLWAGSSRDTLLPLAALKSPWLIVHQGGGGAIAPAEGRFATPGEELGPYTYDLRNPDPRDRPSFATTSTHYWNLAEGSFTHCIKWSPVGLWESAEAPESGMGKWVEGWTDSSRVGSLVLRDSGPEDIVADLTGEAGLSAADEAGRIRLALPMPPVSLSELLPPGMQRAQSSCRAVLFPPHPVELHLSWILDLPADMEAVPVPALGSECPGARFTARRDLVDRRLTVRFDLTWAGDPVTPADYPAFRELVNAALEPKTTEVLLVPRAKD